MKPYNEATHMINEEQEDLDQCGKGNGTMTWYWVTQNDGEGRYKGGTWRSADDAIAGWNEAVRDAY